MRWAKGSCRQIGKCSKRSNCGSMRRRRTASLWDCTRCGRRGRSPPAAGPVAARRDLRGGAVRPAAPGLFADGRLGRCGARGLRARRQRLRHFSRRRDGRAAAGAHPPFAGAEEAAQDIVAAVSFDLPTERRAGRRSHRLFLEHGRWPPVMPATIRRGFAALRSTPRCSRSKTAWVDRIADARDCSRLAPAFGAYRLVTAANVIERWNNDLPGGDRGLFRDDGIAELVFETLRGARPALAIAGTARVSLSERRARRSGSGVQRAAALRSRKAHDAGAADTGRTGHHVDGDRRAAFAGGDRIAGEALSGDRARFAFFVYRKESREAI